MAVIWLTGFCCGFGILITSVCLYIICTAVGKSSNGSQISYLGLEF
jgi:hypothetical protein